MWPWEPPGQSVATGILDDETYDWAAVLDRSSAPVVGRSLSPRTSCGPRTNERACTATGIEVSPTGSVWRGPHIVRRGTASRARSTAPPYCSPDDHSAGPVRGIVVRRGSSLARRSAVGLRLPHPPCAPDRRTRAAEPIVEVPNRPSGLGWLARRPAARRLDDGPQGHATRSRRARRARRPERPRGRRLQRHGRGRTGPCRMSATSGTTSPEEKLRPATLALVQPDGSVSAAATDLAFPNGTVITPDGSTLILGETFGRCLTAFDIGADGTLSNRTGVGRSRLGDARRHLPRRSRRHLGRGSRRLPSACASPKGERSPIASPPSRAASRACSAAPTAAPCI